MSQLREPFVLLSVGGAASLVAACASFFLIRAWRGGRAGDHPHCARCDFNLFGLPPDQARCPECGAELAAAGARRRGKRRPRPIAMTAWGLVAVCGVVAAVVTLRAGAARYDWIRLKPAWVLKRDLATSPWTSRQAQEAGGELGRRLEAGQLSEDDKRRLALMPPLAVPPAGAGVPNWGRTSYLPSVCIDAAADLRRSGKLSDADWAIVCGRIPECTLAVRNPVRHGDPIAVRISVGWTGAATKDVTSVALKAVSARLDGESAELSTIQYGTMNIPNWSVRGGGRTDGTAELEPEQWRRTSEGPHTLFVTFDTSVRVAERATGPALEHRRQVVVAAPVQVVAPDVSTVGLILDPKLRDAVRRSVAPWHAPAMGPLCLRTPEGEQPPVELAFDVYVRQGGNGAAVGAFATENRFPVFWRLLAVPDGFRPGAVDVILRPSNRAAAGSFATQSIWGEEIVFTGVELTAPARPTPEHR